MSSTPPVPIHLHVHSTYTLLGATASVQALAESAATDGLTHLALTDTNVLYGAVAFQQACQAVGVTPIVGMQLTVRLPEPLWATAPNGDPVDRPILIACGATGYRSLCRLSSFIQAKPEREQLAQQGVPWSVFKAESEGLICIAGGVRNPLTRWLINDERKAATTYVGQLAALFDEQLYLALEIHQQADVATAHAVNALGDRFGVNCVAVQPIYCLEPTERPRLRLLAAIDNNCRLDAVTPAMPPDGGDDKIDLHWLSPAEMTERYAEFPAALATTQTIAEQCEPALPDGRPIWPALNLPPNTTPEKALTDLAHSGLDKRYPGLQSSVSSDQLSVLTRLTHELKIINNAGYAPLFLLVAEIVRYARAEKIPVSTRGSVANSLVAYCLDITTVDPIAHDLLFERFLN
ncbi:MAG: PHP domain-containing protein, partial [Caldilineaceae bacterium]|nr:PHP domain-containing protein [Caldilineaceae bacterium]